MMGTTKIALFTLFHDEVRVGQPSEQDDFTQRLVTLGDCGNAGDFDAIVEPYKCAFRTKKGEKLSYRNFRLFRKGIEPTWEHPSNCKGGKWVVQCPKDLSETAFITLVHSLLESYTNSQGVNGVVLQIRKAADLLSVWFPDMNDGASVNRIGKLVKESLGELGGGSWKTKCQVHDYSLRKNERLAERYAEDPTRSRQVSRRRSVADGMAMDALAAAQAFNSSNKDSSGGAGEAPHPSRLVRRRSSLPVNAMSMTPTASPSPTPSPEKDESKPAQKQPYRPPQRRKSVHSMEGVSDEQMKQLAGMSSKGDSSCRGNNSNSSNNRQPFGGDRRRNRRGSLPSALHGNAGNWRAERAEREQQQPHRARANPSYSSEMSRREFSDRSSRPPMPHPAGSNSNSNTLAPPTTGPGLGKMGVSPLARRAKISESQEETYSDEEVAREQAQKHRHSSAGNEDEETARRLVMANLSLFRNAVMEGEQA